jgi:hypothetical protein
MSTITIPLKGAEAASSAETTYVTRAEIRDGYNWSDWMTKRYLGEPDRIEERRSWPQGRYSVHLYLRTRVLAAQAAHPRRAEREEVRIPLLDAVREASRSAYRWRDRAAARWDAGERASAAAASEEKRYWYRLKDMGIMALHRAGELRYIGASPQGMAIYEYGDGGMACFHSTLHPVGVERIPTQGHSETLFVVAKKQKVRLVDVSYTLRELPNHMSGYERSLAPKDLP